MPGCRSAAARRSRRPQPVYPYIRTTVLNQSEVYLKFTVQFGLGLDATANRTAWLDAAVGPVATTVKIRLERLGCTEYHKAKIQTLATQGGYGVAAEALCYFLSNNDVSGGTFQFGTTEEPASGKLTYSAVTAPGVTYVDTNFLFTPMNAGAVYLQTGISNVPSSGLNGRALRALPTQEEGLFELAWKPVASTDGYPISLVNLIYTDSCPPCAGNDPTFC